MSPFEFSARLRACERMAAMTPETLAQFWNVPARHFFWSSQSAPIQFFALGDASDAALLLRGALFFPAASGQTNHVVRSHPRVLPTSDHTQSRYQVLLEQQIADALGGEGSAVVEPKIHGETIRVFARAGELYCATDAAFDGGNPLVGAGIENSRALGVDYGHQAARVLTERYAKVERLTRLRYVAVFVLALPETSPGQEIDAADLILVDVIDPDQQFVERTEKERIAEDYGLSVVPLTARLTLRGGPSDTPLAFVRQCRALARQAQQESLPGVIVKVHADDASDQAFVKVETLAEHDRSREFASSDLAAVVDEITGQYGDTIWADPRAAEEMMLDYLGTHHPSAVRQVHRYIASWQTAKTNAGLG